VKKVREEDGKEISLACAWRWWIDWIRKHDTTGKVESGMGTLGKGAEMDRILVRSLRIFSAGVAKRLTVC
jgi:hypothetical protein